MDTRFKKSEASGVRRIFRYNEWKGNEEEEYIPATGREGGPQAERRLRYGRDGR